MNVLKPNLLMLLLDRMTLSPRFSFKHIFDTSLHMVNYIYTICGIYLLWIILHYFASHLYIKICVPWTIPGFLFSPVIMTTPYCNCLRWIIYNAGNSINHMWITVATFVGQKLLN